MILAKEILKNGKLKKKGCVYYGTYESFYVSSGQRNTEDSFYVNICYYCQGSMEEQQNVQESIHQLLQNRKETSKGILNYEVTQSLIQVEVEIPSFAKKTARDMNETVKELVQLLKQNNCTSGCQECGQTSGSWVNVNGIIAYLCSSCVAEIDEGISNEMEIKKSNKSNPITGIIGAIIGSLAGVAIWMLIYHMGYIAGVTGAVLSLGAMWGYSILGGSLDIKGAILSFIVSVGMVAVANHCSWSLEVYLELRKLGTAKMSFMDVMKNLISILKASNTMGDYIENLVMGYIFFSVVGIWNLVRALKMAKTSYKISQL